MINISTNRKKYILTPNIPSTTTDITYTVSVQNSTVFQGRTKYFIGYQYEVDCSDWIEAFLDSKSKWGSYAVITSVRVDIVFTYTLSDSTTSTESMFLIWTPDTINVDEVTATGNYAYLTILNSGFLRTGNFSLRVPLEIENGVIKGKTINKLDKIGFVDKYGDKHNGSVDNHYEIECYIDPCWRPNVTTGADLEYEKLMLAIQGSKRTTIKSSVPVSGMNMSTTPWETDVHVKDIEKIETYSSYSGNQKVPTYKLTIEIYNH